MPTFDYIVRNEKGGRKTGSISAENYNKAIAMKYRINIIDDLIFADDQVKQLELNQLSDGTYPVQQINVIPQRVGRVYIVVSGEINKNGTVITKSTAVPIDVDQTIGS